MSIKTVLITGANRGIGLEFTKQYKTLGWNVIGSVRDASAKPESVDHCIILDTSVIDSVKGAAQQLKDLKVEKLDLLIHNAGRLLEEKSLAVESIDVVANSLSAQFQTNSIGPIILTQALLPFLQEGSKVAVVSSIMGSIKEASAASHYGYRVSKAAVNMGVKIMSIDLAKKGILLTTMHPGWVDTDMSKHKGPVQPKDSVAGMIKIIDEMDQSNTGTFHDYTGAALPW